MFQRKEYLAKISKEIQNDKILFLIWARQVWKTTLLKNLKQFKIISWNVFYISLDQELKLRDNIENIDDFLWNIYLKSWMSQFDFLLIDEAQSVKNIWIILKGLYDKFKFEWIKTKIIVSWSWSLQIFRWISDSLIWRHKIINIYPFSFKEFLTYKWLNINNTEILQNKSVIHEISKYVQEFLYFWWYPAVVTAQWEREKEETIKDIYQTYINQDIWYFLNKQEIIKFKEFFIHIWFNTCSLYKKNTIAKKLWLSVSTVEKYFFLIENTFLIQTINPFWNQKNKEIKKHQKMYFSDTWLLRNAL